MDADAFELIAADARQRRLAGHVEIVVEESVGEVAHGQPRGIDMLEHHRAVAHQRHRRMQRVRLAAQRPQLLGGAGPVGRLVEALVAERQRLVGAEHQPAGLLRRHRVGLRARQQSAPPPPRRAPASRFQRALVDMRRPDLEAQTGRRQQLAAHVALRGEHQRLSASQSGMTSLYAPARRRRSASSRITAAAVSSIERRVTSMIGQLCLAQSLRE